MELPIADYRDLPKGRPFEVMEFEMEYFTFYAVTPDFKCVLPKKLQHVFYITRDFWKNATMTLQEDGELIITDLSGQTKILVEARHLPSWVYFDVIDFDTETLSTRYFRIKLPYQHFNSEVKINFWKSRKNLYIYFDEQKEIHFEYTNRDEVPFLELAEIPLQNSTYEIDKFSKDELGNVTVHTRYFKCPLPNSSHFDFETDARLQYWNDMPQKFLSCWVNEEGKLNIYWYTDCALGARHLMEYSFL